MNGYVETTIENGELRMEKTKYYSINYEKEVNKRIENGELRIENRQVHYIYGGNGLAAVYILNNDNPDDGSGTMYYVLKDHLGSITGMVMENGELRIENRQLHYIYGGNGLAAVYILNNDNADDGSGTMYYVLKDHLGSITGMVMENGELRIEN